MTTTPDRSTILADIATILADRMGLVGLGPLDEETRFFADLGLASIDTVVLGEALQAHYGRSLPFGELMADLGRRTDRDLALGELVSFLREHLP